MFRFRPARWLRGTLVTATLLTLLSGALLNGKTLGKLFTQLGEAGGLNPVEERK